ncbi:MAG: hypothetical protein ACRDVG_02325 [Jatrophihabitantaceae bacterium]
MFRTRMVLLVLVLVVAGCSSSGGKKTGASNAPSSSAPSTDLAQAVTLGNTMRKGMTGLTSAHISVDAGTLGGKSVGDVKYANGQATASRITLDVGGRTEIVTVDDKTYAMLPPGRNTSGKPWVIVSSASKNEFVRALDSQATISKAAASLPAVADVAATATSVQDMGNSTKGHHYALQIEPARSSGTTLGALLANIGQKTVPVDVYLDSKGRPVLIKIAVKLGTQSLPVTIAVSRFDESLAITAPPANEVAS